VLIEYVHPISVEGGTMSDWRLNRFVFWELVLAYFAIKIWLIQCAQQELAANWTWLLYLALMFAVEARLNDAGFNRLIQLIGALAILIPMSLQEFLQFGYLPFSPRSAAERVCSQPEFADLFSTFNLVPLVLLLALLIWAGTRPRAPQLPTPTPVIPPSETKPDSSIKVLAGFFLVGIIASLVIHHMPLPHSTDIPHDTRKTMVDGGFTITNAALILLGAFSSTSATFAMRYPGWRGFNIFLCALGLTILLCDMTGILFFYPSVLPDHLGQLTIFTLTVVLSNALKIVLGLLFGYALFSLLATRSDQMRLSLVPHQITQGRLAMVLGLVIICLTLSAPAPT
jgi:hypothetical protein